MYKLRQIKYFVLIVALTGCVSKPNPPIKLVWYYESNNVISQEDIDHEKDNLENAFSNYNWKVLSQILGAIGAGIVGGSVQYGIDLTPNALNIILLNALAQPAEMNIIKTNLGNPSMSRWGVSESNEGEITTDWKSIPGKKVGLLWWEKTYQTEVRCIITIKRSYGSPKYSNFSIITEVRERPNVNYKWSSGDPELGRKSFEEIKNMLLREVNKALAAKKGKIDED